MNLTTNETIIALLGLLSVGLLIYTFIMRARFSGRERRNQADLDTRLKKEHAEMEAEVKKLVHTLLESTGQPLAWAVRGELMRDYNLQGIADCFNTYVKTRGVRWVLLADTTGNITVATDKKWEGQPVNAIHTDLGDKMSVDQITVTPLNDREYRVTVPITGVNDRLGTVVVMYDTEER